jgi:alpha-tubulin suppressor-like RCC1 family protein
MKRLGIALFLALAFGCKRNTPVALSLAINENGGCMELKPNPKFGKFVCWGPGVATTRKFPGGDPSKLYFGANKSCGVFGEDLKCWEGDGPPVETGIKGKNVRVAFGAHHFCAATGEGDAQHFQCQGSNDDGQFGTESDWTQYPIKLVAVGQASTCVAWDGPAGILCRGRGMPKEPMLVGSEIRDFRAGPEHMCATTKHGRMYCWGKNDVGQLGDGTTNNAPMPTPVIGIEAVANVAVGARHTCALHGNGTVSCWGANDHHQLANGTTLPSARPATVLGALGVWEIQAVADATCVRLGQDGEVRCWGANDHFQLGDGSTVEHTVPAPVKFH